MTTAAVSSTSTLTLDDARAAFRRVPGYLNAASLGLPPRAVSDAMTSAVQAWSAGQAGAADYDVAVERSRSLFGSIAGVHPSWVAVGSQVSVFAGLVAAALPDGSEVVCVEGDFSSMVFPFIVQADRGVTVRHVAPAAVADAIGPSTTLVAFSAAQSASGEVLDVAAIAAAARRHDTVTFCDTTQATGWLRVDASELDLTVCSAYKWLCAPRGSAFLTVAPTLHERLPLRPHNAGWYAGESIWDSCYGPGMQLAGDARRFDVSPAWLAWVGTVPALELFAAVDHDEVRRWDAGLADRLLEGLGLEPEDRPVVSLPDPDGVQQERLSAAGLVVAGRAGRVRLAFHLWNDESDVDRALHALHL